MVEAAGRDVVDMNFGCTSRRSRRPAPGASCSTIPTACRLVEAVASAVTLPVSVKMRRGVENGSRTCLEVGPSAREGGRVLAHAAPALGEADVHRHADHSLTASSSAWSTSCDRLRRRDVALRRRTRSSQRRRRRGDGRRARRETPGCCARSWGSRRSDARGSRRGARPLHAQTGARARRAARERVLKKFYGWYLGRGRFPRPFKQELVMLPTIGEVEERLLAAAPGARFVIERLQREVPDHRDESSSTRSRSRSSAAVRRGGARVRRRS